MVVLRRLPGAVVAAGLVRVFACVVLADAQGCSRPVRLDVLLLWLVSPLARMLVSRGAGNDSLCIPVEQNGSVHRWEMEKIELE